MSTVVYPNYDFTISSYCNAACPSCKRYESNNKPIDIPNEPLHPGLNQIHMDFDMFKFIIERDIDLFTNKYITYEGELGDPMVHPHIKSFIDLGAGIFKSLRVVTNGGIRINTRPKFRIKERLIPSVINQYEKNKFELSNLVLGN